ncbi:MAG: amidohydrolase [Solirubrobacterales bacterium]
MGSAALFVEGATLDGVEVGLRCADGVIAELGPGVAGREGDERVDGVGTAIAPGFINAHTHAAMTLFRGYADDLPLMEWLEQHIWPAEARLEPEDVYWGARLACAEMIRSGTVGFWDMYWQPGATARAAEDAGLRATIGAPLIDGADSAATARLREEAALGLAELDGSGDLISPAFAPHSIYTVSEASLRWLAERSAESGIPIQIHLSEIEAEVEGCLREHGLRPAHYLDRLGVLGPRTLLAHAVWLDDGERDAIAASGATIVTNPSANLKLAVGEIFDYPAARAAGIPVALGTDGAGSNNALDLLGELKQFALIQKHRAGDTGAITATEALAVATGRRAPLLGAAAAPRLGGAADFILVRVETPALALGTLDAGLAYAANATVVDTTVVAGRVLMSGGRLAGEGLERIVAQARERASRLGLWPAK